MSSQFDSQMLKSLEVQMASETRRKHQQGEGRPIISAELNGFRFVAIGNTIAWGKWATVQDFLGDYIRSVLTPEWGNRELAKPFEDRHPLLKWYDAVCRYQRQVILEPGKVFTAPMIGATAAYFDLAYSLYLLAHNADLQKRLLSRLKDPNNFHGAYYETRVAAWFILAGFDLALENEADPSSTHCEFTATSKSSGKQFSVEAKSRTPNKDNLDIGNQMSKALKKTAQD